MGPVSIGCRWGSGWKGGSVEGQLNSAFVKHRIDVLRLVDVILWSRKEDFSCTVFFPGWISSRGYL